MDQCGVGCKLPLGFASILRISERVHNPIHWDGGFECHAIDLQQTVHYHCARRSERTGELGFEQLRDRYSSGGLDTLGGLIFTLNQRSVFAVTADPNMKSAVKSEDLADVVSQDIKTGAYLLTD